MKKIDFLPTHLLPKWILVWLLIPALFVSTLNAQKGFEINTPVGAAALNNQARFENKTQKPVTPHILEKGIPQLTFYPDRASFDAATCGTLTFEDFEPDCTSYQVVPFLDETTTTNCFPAGFIEPGVQFDLEGDHENETDHIFINPSGNYGYANTSQAPFSYWESFSSSSDPDKFTINFSTGVRSVGLDLTHITYSGNPNFLSVHIEIFAGPVLVGTTMANSSGAGAFWGFTSAIPITKIRIWDEEPGYSYWEGVDNIAFGTCCATLTGDNLGSPIPASGTGTFDCSTAQTSTATMGATGTIGTDWEISSVDLDITHTFDADLVIDLIAPDGTTLNLSHRNGGGSNNYTNTVFMDGGASIVGASAPFTGTFEPQGGTFAGAFAGTSVMGDWRLVICDQLSGDHGTLNDFEITFCQLAPTGCITADEAPMIDTPCPGTITLCGAQNVSWTEPTATDNCDTPDMTSSHSPGDFFDVGTTTVTYTFTDMAGLTATCNFDVVINPLPSFVITATDLPLFCQGLKELYVKFYNLGDLTPPLTYSWSHGLGSDPSVIVGENNTIYSCTVTDANGCSAVETYDMNIDASQLLSAYVMIGSKDLYFSSSTMDGGGAGVFDGDEVKVVNSSGISTFLKSNVALIDGSSSVANFIQSDPTVILPPFLTNSFVDYSTLVVASGTTETLSGSNYGNIYVMQGATVIFDNPEVYIRSIQTKGDVTISFTQPTTLLLRNSMHLARGNMVNVGGPGVVVYVGDKASISQGSTVEVDIYARENIKVNDPSSWLMTSMKGMFISMDGIKSGANVAWDWNLGCSTFLSSIPLAEQVNDNLPFDVAGTDKKRLEIFPNPAKSEMNIVIGDYMGQEIDIVITNSMGMIVWERSMKDVQEDVTQVDMTNNQFVNGLYFVTVKALDSVKTKSIVLAK